MEDEWPPLNWFHRIILSCLYYRLLSLFWTKEFKLYPNLSVWFKTLWKNAWGASFPPLCPLWGRNLLPWWQVVERKFFCDIFLGFLKNVFLILFIFWLMAGWLRESFCIIFSFFLVSEIYSDFFQPREVWEAHAWGTWGEDFEFSYISFYSVTKRQTFEFSIWSSVSRQKVGKKNMNFLLAMHFTKDMERTVRFHFWQIWILNNIFAK